MASLSRKIRRKKELKNKKHNRKNLKKALNALSGMPTNCTDCATNFNPETDTDSWIVHFSPGNDTISLFCPDCAPNNSAN